MEQQIWGDSSFCLSSSSSLSIIYDTEALCRWNSRALMLFGRAHFGVFSTLLRAYSAQLGLDIIARIQFWQLLDFSQTDFLDHERQELYPNGSPPYENKSVCTNVWPFQTNCFLQLKKHCKLALKYWKHRNMLARETNSLCFVHFFPHLIIGSLCVVRPQGGEEREGQLVGRRCTGNIFFCSLFFSFSDR